MVIFVPKLAHDVHRYPVDIKDIIDSRTADNLVFFLNNEVGTKIQKSQ